MAASEPLDPAAERAFLAGVEHAGHFFMGTAPAHLALRKLVRLLEEDGIPYAIVGAMALNELGYRRVTEDVDVLLTKAGLQAFKDRHLGRGYVERFPGSRGLTDTEHRVPIDIVVTGDYPGDGKPKPVAFPDPESTARRGATVNLLPLPTLVELKLASGMTAPHRLRDLADVQELIKASKLPRDLAADLSTFVRDKYFELWDTAQLPDPFAE